MEEQTTVCEVETWEEEYNPCDYFIEQVPASINPLFCVKGINFESLFRVLHHNDKEDVEDLLKTRDKPLVKVPVHHYRLMSSYRNDNDRYTVYNYYNWIDWYDKVVYDDGFPPSFSSKLKKVLAVSWKNLQMCRKSKEMWYKKMETTTDKKLKAYYRKQAEKEKRNAWKRSKIYNEWA